MSKKENYINKLWNWRRRAAGGLPSTGMNVDNSANSPQSKPLDTPSSHTYHQSCQTLRYNAFMEIMMHGDLRWLIISGNPSLPELQTAWEEILNEYSSLVKTEKSDTIFDVYKKITHTEWQIGFIEECIKALKIRYDEDIAVLLNERGFGTVDHSGDWPTYLRSLYAIEMSAKMLIVLLNQYKAEYKSLSPDTEDVITEPTPMRYAKDLAILSKFQGSWIVKEKITVLEYCAIVNNYLDYVKANKKEVPNGR